MRAQPTESRDLQPKAPKTAEELAKLRTTIGSVREKTPLIGSIRQGAFLLENKTVQSETKKEILKNRENFESINIADIITLKSRGVNLAKFLLININAPTEDIEISEQKEFQVNFGMNTDMKHLLGAGDILPSEVREATIDGVRWTRMIRGGRVGYYAKAWKWYRYLPIYDRTTIKIEKIGTLDPEQRKLEQQAEQSKQEQSYATTVARGKRRGEDPGKVLDYLSHDALASAVEFAPVMTQRLTERKYKNSSELRKDFEIQYRETIDEVCKRTNIPQTVLIQLIEKESTYNPEALSRAGACGLGQILPSTWKEIQSTHAPRYGYDGAKLQSTRPEDQIRGAGIYLAAMRDQSGGRLEDGLKRYFWVSLANKELAAFQNQGIEKIRRDNHLPDTPEGLIQGYLLYLGFSRSDLTWSYDASWLKKIPDAPLFGDMDQLLRDLTKIGKYGTYTDTDGDGKSETWCGLTARKHALEFGAEFPMSFNSSQALSAYASTEKVMTDDPTTLKRELLARKANVIDITFGNTRGSRMGHRVCGIVDTSWAILVYDPYFRDGALARSDARKPIPYDLYMTEMLTTYGKKLIGGWFYQSDHHLLKQPN